MTVKRTLDWGFYICLLVPAVVFVRNYVEEYLEGKTFFVETTEQLTLDDLPVTTICFGYLGEPGPAQHPANMTAQQRIKLAAIQNCFEILAK